MRKSVEESYPALWHYTTGAGLHGIITSQQLWATDIFYLNDAEEFTGFFDRKLLHILEAGVREGIVEAKKTKEGQNRLKDFKSESVILKDVPAHLLEAIRTTTLKLQVYVTSFCSPSGDGTEDGLLSQWRGYGLDGGYAVVFDTKKLVELLNDEQQRFFYSYGHWGDVDYFDSGAAEAVHEESLEWEEAIRKSVAGLVVKGDYRIGEELFEPILSLATRHKHRGFREECEVRISCVTSMKGVDLDAARAAGDTRPKKPVQFALRGGILVPYIALFERPSGERAKLPITKIIVGPHPEKLKRQMAIEKLLEELEIGAKVEMSDIPYLGH